MLRWKNGLFISLLAVVVFSLAACERAVDVPPDAQEPDQPVSLITPAEVQEAIYAPLAGLFANKPDLVMESLGDIVNDIATEDFVVATVDDWPILFSELAFRAKSRDVAILPPDHNFTMNTIVEEKAALSEATALGVLPTLEEAAAFSAEKKQELLAATDGEAVVEAHAAQLGVSVDEYWDVVAPYYDYKELALNRVWQVRYLEAEAAGLNADGANTTWAEDYYWEKKEEWKKQVVYTQVTDQATLQFSPNLQNLVLERRGSPQLDE